ncbi:ABC transporter ATP-binding protein [Parafrankia elaeagni]|uniref:ABC transporter ATP-binding protein n=1 Tax=Parafrankia elaeagni TaxID=222534 RepID=UPI0009FEE214
MGSAPRGQEPATMPLPRPRAKAAAPVIELERVGKSYRAGALDVTALRDVSTSIAAGEYVAIVGPSGSGKSTLMHIIGCLDVLTTGIYRLSGEDVSTMTEAELAEIRNRRIGFVFQQFNLLPSLSALRNVELPLVYRGERRDVRRQRARTALERVGLATRVEHRPGELSGGQQQRVAVARALVGDPSLILADEPTGNLDSTATRDVLDLLDELHDSGRTIVLITHEREVADRARRVLHIRDGVIESDSGPGTSAGTSAAGTSVSGTSESGTSESAPASAGTVARP